MSRTTNSRVIRATPERLYRAFTEPHALETWMAPGDMTGKVHDFDLRVGGGYTMSLYYRADDASARGKSGSHEDRYSAVFRELAPGQRLVVAIRFDASDAKFQDEMTMTVDLQPQDAQHTRVTIAFDNLPGGIDPADNEAGTESSLGKLERYVSGS